MSSNKKHAARRAEWNSIVRGAIGATILSLGLITGATASTTSTEELKSSLSKDPIKVVVSLSEQRLEVYRGTERVASTKISSGKRGHTTPAGIFSVLEKRKRHFSNLYNNAPMPYMQRLTWSGIALHEGRIPGYPASHGCIRLPKGFASKLFKWTSRGAHVVVTDYGLQGAPTSVNHDVLFQPLPTPNQSDSLMSNAIKGSFPADEGVTASIQLASLSPTALIDRRGTVANLADDEFERARLAAEEKRSNKPLRILITKASKRDRTRDTQAMLNELGFSAGPVDGIKGRKTRQAIKAYQASKMDEQTGELTEAIFQSLAIETGRPGEPNGYMYVRQNMKPVLKTPIKIREVDQPLGTHMFSTASFNRDAGTTKWLALQTKETQEHSAMEALSRIEIAPHVRRMMAAMLTPGSSLVISDKGISRETTPKGTDFIVLTR